MPPRLPIPNLLALPVPLRLPLSCRSSFSTSQLRKDIQYAASKAHGSTSNAKWLSDMKARIGKCIMFGISTSQCRTAAGVLRILGEEWRELVAGREGFLTSPRRAGLRKHKVVWGEMDSMGHVNNVMYVRYAESARVQWTQNYALHIDPGNKTKWMQLCTPLGIGMILKSIKIDYKFPMTWPDHISVFHKLRQRPEKEGTASSFVLDVVIVSERHQRVAARCEEDIVVYDYREGRKKGMEGWMVDAFRGTWEEQEAERERVSRRVEEVEDVVRRLEKESWDRDGAVEDMGAKA